MAGHAVAVMQRQSRDVPSCSARVLQRTSRKGDRRMPIVRPQGPVRTEWQMGRQSRQLPRDAMPGQASRAISAELTETWPARLTAAAGFFLSGSGRLTNGAACITLAVPTTAGRWRSAGCGTSPLAMARRGFA